MGEAELVAEAKRVIDAIAATPRFAGSAEEARARHLCAVELERIGLSVSEEEFEFSQWPGRWGIPFVSALLVIATAITAAAASRDLNLGGLAFMATFLLGPLIVSSRRQSATAKMSWLRSRATNLEATRGSPRVWLVAHLDSKSQSVPMLVRVASHVALLAVVVVETATLFLAQWGVVHEPHWSWIALAAVAAALPSLLCFVGNDSRGALDNATGVAAVILAARLVPSHLPIGVLLTSGEELDLAGARAWRKGVARKTVMINCDTVDDVGAWRCMYDERPHAAVLAAENRAKRLGLNLRIGRIIRGILTDTNAFNAKGLTSITISRGTLSTLARLHTPSDNLQRVTGEGAAAAARLLAGIVEELA